MSDFTGEGFSQTFPNTYADRQEASKVVEWSDERLENKTAEYYLFLNRTDLMPRAINAANEILQLLNFETDMRYDESLQRLEDEVCDGTE